MRPYSPLSLLSIGLLLAGCSSASALAPIKIDPPTGGPSTEADPNAVAPDASLIELAETGINAGVLLGPMLHSYAQVAAAYYTARTKYLKPSYRVSDIDGWTFADGWYTQTLDSGASTLRAQFTDTNGTPPAWDVTLASNYDLHPNFPTELAKVRFEADKALPNASRMAITLFAPLGADASVALEAYGSGTITTAAPLGEASFEALDATCTVGGDVTQGDLGLKSLTGAAILQFSGTFVKTGLSGTAKLSKNGHPAGDVTYNAGAGHWQVTNGAGVYPLQ